MISKYKDLFHFFKNVLMYLNIHGWKLELIKDSSEGYCWKNRKVITIGLNSKHIKSLILHEISHIRTCIFCNNRHSYSFWKEYRMLTKKFLGEVGDFEFEKEYLNVGFYKLCYDNGYII